MNRSLWIALLGAALGFAGWIWISGPGTSVPNAAMALACAVAAGRIAWWLAARFLREDDPQPPSPPPPPPTGRRAPPPADAAAWRRPDGAD